MNCTGIVLLLASALLLTLGGRTMAGEDTARIDVGPNILMTTDKPARPHVEPHVAVNPRNPNNLIAATIVAHGPQSDRFTCEVLSSFDGGHSWFRKTFQAIAQTESCADPWVAFGSDDSAYVSLLVRDSSMFGGRAGIVVLSSSDGGRTWSEEPAKVPFGQGTSYDRPTLVVDTTEGLLAGTIYVTAGQNFPPEGGVAQRAISISRSTDSGRTFSDPVHVRPSKMSMGSTGVEVLSDGTLVVLMRTHKTVRGQRSSLEGTPRAWILASNDGGKTFSKPFLIGDAFLGPDLLAVDRTNGPFRDNLYVVGTPRITRKKEVVFTRSTDRGKTWAKRVQIDTVPGNRIVRDAPMIAVNQHGVIGVAWYDKRDDPENRCNHIYFTSSLDGGRTFLPEVRISTEPSCPLTPQNGFAGRRWRQGGDYSGMVAGAEGRFHVVWADARSGVYQLYTATVTVTGKAPSTGDSQGRE